MAINFRQLRELKAKGLSLSTITVYAYLIENGPQPVGIIADVCGVSVRSVERALAALRRAGLSPTSLSHDHDHGHGEHEGTATVLAGGPAPNVGADDVNATTQDPIRTKLLGYEVLAWCVDRLLSQVPREVLERQLAYHEYRLANGFRFTGHPARYLFRACLGDFAPPEGFHRPRHEVQATEQTTTKPTTPATHVGLTDERKAMKLAELRTELRLALSRKRTPLVEATIRAVHRKAAEAGIPIESVYPPEVSAVG